MMPAIHYSAIRPPEGSRTIYGLQVAVEAWLRAYFTEAKQDSFSFLVGDEASRQEVLQIAASCGVKENALSFPDARFVPQNGAHAPVIFRPDLDPHDLFWQRELTAPPSFAFCGLAHAIAGRAGGEILWKYVLHPSAAGDAIICPSRAIKSVIERFFALADETVQRRFGGRFRPQIDLPVIPLGVDARAIGAKCTPEKRAEQRARLGIAEDETVLLWVGRLSAATKAHPVAMFRAAEDTARRTGKTIRLLLNGYFVPSEAGADFAALSALLCPTAKVTFVPHNDPAFPDGLWAAGDIFLSLIDNVQESFGLTPIEAMAARLPRVISDWDGYRDSVTQGEDGFLIPTLQPNPGMGQDLASLALAERETYGVILGKTALSVAVDRRAATEALTALVENPDLRRRMAEAAETRLKAYEWSRLIPAYEEVWAACAERRKAALRDAPAPAPFPAIPADMPDPFTLYESFASATLADATAFTLTANKAEIKDLWGNRLNAIGADMMLPADLLTQLISYISGHKGVDLSTLYATFPAAPRAQLERTLLWLVKLGVVDAEGSAAKPKISERNATS